MTLAATPVALPLVGFGAGGVTAGPCAASMMSAAALVLAAALLQEILLLLQCVAW